MAVNAVRSEEERPWLVITAGTLPAAGDSLPAAKERVVHRARVPALLAGLWFSNGLAWRRWRLLLGLPGCLVAQVRTRTAPPSRLSPGPASDSSEIVARSPGGDTATPGSGRTVA